MVALPARRRGAALLLLAVAALAGVTVACVLLRDLSLQTRLRSCPAYGTVTATARYANPLTANAVVFDLQSPCSAEARRIDCVHLFLQFALTLDLDHVDRVILASGGHRKFYVDGEDLRDITGTYGSGGRVWAFNKLPERVRTMSGERAYGAWTGAWIGAVEKQTEDLNSFIEAWSGY